MPLLQRLLRVLLRGWAQRVGPPDKERQPDVEEEGEAKGEERRPRPWHWQYYYLPYSDPAMNAPLHSRLRNALVRLAGVDWDLIGPRLNDELSVDLQNGMPASSAVTGSLARLLSPHGVAFDEASVRMSADFIPFVTLELVQPRRSGVEGGVASRDCSEGAGAAACGRHSARARLAAYHPGDEYSWRGDEYL
jgi:hypothetical protein